MRVKKTLRGYQGIFFDNEVEQQLISLQKNGLNSNIENMHITFKYGDIEKYPEELIGKEFTIKIVGYASDGKNSGFSVEIPKELKTYYKSCSIPHITISIRELGGIKGKPADTAKLDFKILKEPIEIQGKLGYFIFGKGISMDNFHINEYQKSNIPQNIRVLLVPKYMDEAELSKAGIHPTATVEAEYGEKVITGEQITLAHHTKEYENNPAPCNTPNVPILDDSSTIVISHIDLDTLRWNCSFNGKKKTRS